MENPEKISIHTIARYLRQESSRTERLLWDRLKDRREMGFKFRRKHPIKDVIVDFACCKSKIAIEIIKETETDVLSQSNKDVLKEKDYFIIFFLEEQILDNIDVVTSTIKAAYLSRIPA